MVIAEIFSSHFPDMFYGVTPKDEVFVIVIDNTAATYNPANSMNATILRRDVADGHRTQIK